MQNRTKHIFPINAYLPDIRIAFIGTFGNMRKRQKNKYLCENKWHTNL